MRLKTISFKMLIVLLTTAVIAVGVLWIGRSLKDGMRQYGLNEELWSAACIPDVAQIRYLISQGANPNYSADGTFTVLMNAYNTGNKHAIEAVLEGRPNLDPLLSQAVRTRNEDFARFLIKNGADPVAPDFDGSTALSLARDSRQTELVVLFEESIAPHDGTTMAAPDADKTPRR